MVGLKLDWLEAFVAFAEELSFTRAAERLHISQPALHVQVRRLSEELGVPLYSRAGKRLELTPEGRETEAFAREMTQRAEEFPARLTGGAQRRVTLAAGEGAYLYLLGDAIKSFARRRQTELRLMTADRAATVEAVLTGRAHLGVTTLEAVPDGLETRELTRVEQVLVFPPKHRLARRKTVAIRDLVGEELVVPPAGRPLRDTLERHLPRDRWHVAVECVGWEVTLQFVSFGLGVAIVNGCCRIPASLRAVPIRDLPKVRYQILHRRGPLRETSRELAEVLVAQAGAWRKRVGYLQSRRS